MTDSYLVGLLVGYGWFSLSDWEGSLGKGILHLEVRDYTTGSQCSPCASLMRNLPIIVTALPVRLHQALLGIDRKQYIQSHRMLVIILAFAGLVVLLGLIMGALNSSDRRHIGDRLAGTIVVARKKVAVARKKPLS